MAGSPGTQIDIASGDTAHTADSSAVEGRLGVTSSSVERLNEAFRRRASYQAEATRDQRRSLAGWGDLTAIHL